MRDTTVAIILGGSDFTNAELGVDQAFSLSAEAFRDYLLRPDGFGLPPENLLDCFDTKDGPSSVDASINDFLIERKTALESEGEKIENVLLYYTGHGQFAKPGNDYVLALPFTSRKREGSTAYRVTNLATTIRENARHSRRIILLDCCFAASAYEAFQSGVLDVVEQQTQDVFARSGTSLLCAAAPKQPALTRVGEATASGQTVFSEALIEVLSRGIPEVDRQLMTLAEVGYAVEQSIAARFAGDAPRPQVKSPDEREGDAARIPLFPNAARSAGAAPRRKPQAAGVKFARPAITPSNDPIVVALEEASDPLDEQQLLGVERHVTVSLDPRQVEDLLQIVEDLQQADIDRDALRERGIDAWDCLEAAQPVLRMVIDNAVRAERPQPIAWTGKAALLTRVAPAIQIACLDDKGDETDFLSASHGVHYFHPLRVADTPRGMQRRQGRQNNARISVQSLTIDGEPDDLLPTLAEAAEAEVAMVSTDSLHTPLNRFAELVHGDSATRVLLGFGEFVATAESLESLLRRLPAVSIGGRRLASEALTSTLRRYLPKQLSEQSVPVALESYRRHLVREAHAANDPVLLREALCWTTWSWIGRPLFATDFGESYPAAFPHLMSLRSIASRDWYFDREAGIPRIYRAKSLVQPAAEEADQFHLYLTGAGGTGKSCFLRYVYETIKINQPDVLPVWYKVDAPSSEWGNVVRRVKEEVVNALEQRTDKETAAALTDDRKDLPFFLNELVENLQRRKHPIRRVTLFIDQLERTFESGESPELDRLVAISRAFIDLLDKVGTGKGIRLFIASRKQYLPDFLSSFQKAAEYNLHFNVLQRISREEQVAFVQRVHGWCRDNDLVSARLDPQAARELAAASDGHPLETVLALIQLFSLEHKGEISKHEVETLKPWEKIFYADEQLAAKDDIDWYFFLAMAHARTEIVRFEEVWWRLRLVKRDLTRRVDNLRRHGVLERMWLLGHLGRTIYPRPLDDEPAHFLEFFHANMRDHLIGSVMNFGGDEAERGGRRGGTPAVWRALDRLTAAARDWKQSQQFLLRDDITELMRHKEVFIEPVMGEGDAGQVEAFYLLFLRDNKADREDLFDAAKECFVYSAVVHDVLGRWAFRTIYRNVADQVERCQSWLRRSDAASRIRILQYLVELRDGRADHLLASIVMGDDPAPIQQLADILSSPLYAVRYRRAFVRALLRQVLDSEPAFPDDGEATTRFGEFLAAACRSDRDELLSLLEALAKDVTFLEDEGSRRAMTSLLDDSDRLAGWLAGSATQRVDLGDNTQALQDDAVPRLELRAGSEAQAFFTAERLARWREGLEAQIGLPVPEIVLTDGELSGIDRETPDPAMKAHEIELRIDARTTSLGVLYPDAVQTLRRHWSQAELELPEGAHTDYNEGLQEVVVWVEAAELDKVKWRLPRIEPERAMFDWLQHNLRRNVDSVFTFYDLMPFLNSLDQRGDPRFDLRELLRTISGNFAAVWRVLTDLARERVPLGEMQIELMLELQELVRQMGRTNTLMLTQKLREGIGLAICRQFADMNNQLPVLLLETELEQSLVEHLQIGDDRQTLAVSAEDGMTVAAAIRLAFENVLQTEDIAPVLVCEDALRSPIQRLVRHFDGRIFVLSYTELSPEIRPESKGAVVATIAPRAAATADDPG